MAFRPWGPQKARQMLARAVPALFLASVLLLLAGCGKNETEKEPVVSVQTAPVSRSTIKRIVTAEGVLYPLKGAALTPKVSAPVKTFYVNRGSRVRQGQLLAVLENRDLAAAKVENQGTYEEAQANYGQATSAQVPEEMQKAELELQQDKAELDAQQKLYDSRERLFREGALPRKELDQAAVALTQARSKYEVALKHLQTLQAGGKERQLKAAAGQLTAAKGKYLGSSAQLGYSEIRSPIDGVVTDRPLYPGETATAGTALLTVMDLSQVVARTHIPQEEAALLKSGDSATLTAQGVGEFPAKVTLVSPAVDQNSTTVEVWVQAANPTESLRPGSTVRVSMVAQQVPDAVVVPAAALLTTADGHTSVMLAGADGRAHQQAVQVGIRQDPEVQITSGLTPGQRVITSGNYGLPDGARIRVENASAGAAAQPGKQEKD